MHPTKLAAPAVVFFLLISVSLAAQNTTASVVISVVDPSGSGVPHAFVRVIPAPDPAQKPETDEKGKLALGLKAGSYALFVQVGGFKRFVTHIEVKSTDKVQTVPVVLEVADALIAVGPAKDEVQLYTYPYHDPVARSASDLKALPHITVTIHNPHTGADETYSGVRVADLLLPLGVPLRGELRGVALSYYLVATGSDGYQVVLALAEVDPSFHSGEVVVADAMNGKPLSRPTGPFRLVVTEDKRPARSVHDLISLAVESTK
jgi:hypothetical protein